MPGQCVFKLVLLTTFFCIMFTLFEGGQFIRYMKGKQYLTATFQNEEMNWSQICTNISFSPVPLPRVALASFPGSGNSWTRHLVEITTGITTGAIYCNAHHKDSVNGKCSHGDDVILIKTHEPMYIKRVQCKKAVLLLRNPYKSFIAEFNRRKTDSTSIATKEIYKAHFSSYVKGALKDWINFHKYWLNFKGLTYVLLYKNLLNDTVGEISKLLHFLNRTMTERSKQCLSLSNEGPHHRKKSTSFDPMEFYTADLKQKIDTAIEEIEPLFKDIDLHTKM